MPQLEHLKQITTIGRDVSDKLQAYFSLKETDMVNLCVNNLKFLLLHSKTTAFTNCPINQL